MTDDATTERVLSRFELAEVACRKRCELLGTLIYRIRNYVAGADTIEDVERVADALMSCHESAVAQAKHSRKGSP